MPFVCFQSNLAAINMYSLNQVETDWDWPYCNGLVIIFLNLKELKSAYQVDTTFIFTLRIRKHILQ